MINDNLNEEQLQAINAKMGANLVIAAAGTGKTSTIVARIANLINKGIKPEEILLLTFTNKASNEMISRVSKKFDKNIIKKINSGTFHSIAYKWLKDKHNIILKQPSDIKIVFKTAYNSIVEYKSIGDMFSYIYLFDLYQFYQNRYIDIKFNDWLESRYIEHTQYLTIYQSIVDEFEKLKSEYNFASFNDLLILPLKMLNPNELKYKEILIDEYQDTNRLQARIIDFIKPESIFCVGDYDQSIYAFNGADINNIAKFKDKYKDAHIYSLNKNYRSGKLIIDLANRVIENNPRIYEKKLIVTKNSSIPPKLLIYDELYEQYNGIARNIKDSSSKFSDIAVIFRNNISADGIEAILRELSIPTKRKSGVSFFDLAEIRTILNILNIIINPKDIMSFINIFEYSKGVGSNIAKEIYELLIYYGNGSILKGVINHDKNLSIKGSQNSLFGDALFNNDLKNISKNFKSHPILQYKKISSYSAEYLNMFYDLMLDINNKNRPEYIIKGIKDSKIFNYIKSAISKKRATDKDGKVQEKKQEEKVLEIDQKLKIIYEMSKKYDDLKSFLNIVVLGGNEATSGEGVNLLTIHSSKGLEFEEVYVLDLMDGRFPNRKLMKKEGSIEEERRLFYVAVTRAKKRLYLSYAKYDNIKKINFIASLFLYEANLLKKDKNYEKLSID